MTDLERKIIKLSLDLKQKNLLLNLSNISIIHSLISLKNDSDCFIFGTPKCGLSLYACMDVLHKQNAEEIYNENGINYFSDSNKNVHYYGDVDGYAISFAIGRALSSKNKVIFLLNDFEIYSGSIIEALNYIKNNNISNIEINCNITGYNLTCDIFTYIAYVKNQFNNIKLHLNTELKERLKFLNVKNPDDIVYKYEDILT
jgi:hypothetical protein